MEERLQKIIARAGVTSRRNAEILITSGRVRVNGQIVTELGTRVDPHRDRIEVDGRRIVVEKPAYFLFHKPKGMVCTMHDPEGRPCVGEVVKRLGVRVHPVGRLDFHTSGALLLTNDGEMTNALLHPRGHVPKVYLAKVGGVPSIETLERLRQGVTLDDGQITKPAKVFVLRSDMKSTWLHITLYEGRNRQIHRMGEAVGHEVLRLVRQSFAGITIEGLKAGEYRPLTEKEVALLKKRYLNPFLRAKLKAMRKALLESENHP
ncbi:MAG: pseudouridine synthase [Sandaracinaceae bacterium]|nr:pseudouridine synthase [Sandaracinaceae bacterium]